MANNEDKDSNPWCTGGSILGMKLGDPQSGLTLARRHGFVPITQEPEDIIEGGLVKSQSIQMISAMQEVSQVKSILHQVELELHRYLLDRDMADLTHVDHIEKYLDKVNTLLSHITEVLKSKELLLGRLQCRTTENVLRIEAAFQKHSFNVINTLGPAVTDITIGHKKLEWVGQFDPTHTSLSKKLTMCDQSFTECKEMEGQFDQLHVSQKIKGLRL